jgi:hypothetical protein
VASGLVLGVTPTRRLLDLHLNGTLDEYVRTLRERGTSWASIADNLIARTGIRVSDETLRLWYVEVAR